MILGKTGKLPGELAPEIKQLAKDKGMEFNEGNPQMHSLMNLTFQKRDEREYWDRGEDEEELFEFAMHERQYRDYKSGVANNVSLLSLRLPRQRQMLHVITRPVVESLRWTLRDYCC